MFVSKAGRRIRIFSESSYYGMGEILNNNDADAIVEEKMFALWREGRFYEATNNALHSLIDKINNNLTVREQEKQGRQIN